MKTVCVFGDSIALGRSDDSAAGWPLRLAALEGAAGHDLTLYNLSVAQDTSVDIADRWEADCRVRLRRAGGAAGLVFAFGLYDMADEAGGALRVPLMESMAQAQAIVSDAAEVRPVLWVGPTPVRRQDDPVVEDGQWLRFSAHRLEALNAAYGEIARRIGVPYLDLFAVLGISPAWQVAQRLGDGVHPVAQGHAAIAAAVHGWSAWRQWIDGMAVDGCSGRLGRTG